MLRDEKIDIYKIGGGELTAQEVIAIQAVWAGEAEPGQQRLAMELIVDRISMADHMSFLEGRRDGSSFLAGRSFVGKLLRSFIRKRVGEMTQ